MSSSQSARICEARPCQYAANHPRSHFVSFEPYEISYLSLSLVKFEVILCKNTFTKKYNKSSSVVATPCSFSDTRVEALKRQNGQNDEIVQFSQISHNEINCSILRYLGPTVWFRTWIFIIVFGSCPVRTDAHNWLQFIVVHLQLQLLFHPNKTMALL